MQPQPVSPTYGPFRVVQPSHLRAVELTQDQRLTRAKQEARSAANESTGVTVGRTWPDRRATEGRVDIDLSYGGVERRKPVTVRDADGTLIIRPDRDAFRFDEDRIVSGLMPFVA